MVPSGGNRTGASVERAPRAVYSSTPDRHVGHAVDVVGIALLELLGIGLAVMLLAGCASLAPVVEALGKDASSACVTVSTPYGTAAAIRTNQPGSNCSASGGQCSCSTPGVK